MPLGHVRIIEGNPLATAWLFALGYIWGLLKSIRGEVIWSAEVAVATGPWCHVMLQFVHRFSIENLYMVIPQK